MDQDSRWTGFIASVLILILAIIVTLISLLVDESVKTEIMLFFKNITTENYLNTHKSLLALSSHVRWILSLSTLWLIVAIYKCYCDFRFQSKIVARKNQLEITNKALDKKLTQTIEDLTQERTGYQELCEEVAKTLLRETFDTNRLQGKERISLYSYNNANQTFSLVSRHSERPDLSKVHRQVFPKNKGVIGKAFESHTGEYIEKSCPCYTKNPGAHKDYVTKEHGLSSEEAAKLTMKSCRFFCYPIKFNGSGRIGMIVLESTNPDFFEKTRERTIRQNFEKLSISFSFIILKINELASQPESSKKLATPEKDLMLESGS